MRFNGAYGTTLTSVPNYGGAYNALPHNVPMGHNGLIQPMLAGMPTSQYQRQPVAQQPAAQGLPMANGRFNAHMPYGMRTGQHMRQPVAQGLPMASGHYYDPMPNGMRSSIPMAPRVQHPAVGLSTAYGRPNTAMSDGTCSYVSHNVALSNSQAVRATPEQRPAPLVAPANLGNRVAYNALPAPAAAPVPVAQAAPPAEVIDLTDDVDEPTVAPSTPVAGTKRARSDRTSKNSAKAPKKPRYTAFPQGYAVPTLLASSPVAYTPSASSVPALSSSSATASDAEVLPATPSPAEQHRVPRKKREDPHKLLGNVHYNFVAKPVNGRLEASDDQKVVRPVYTAYADPSLKRVRRSKEDKKRSKKSSKTPASAEKAVEAAASGSSSEPEPAAEIDEAELAAQIEARFAEGSNSEDEAAYESDDELEAPAAASVDAGAADSTSEEAASAEEEFDESEAIAFDDDDNVRVDARGQPMLLSAWRASQAADKEPQEWELALEGTQPLVVNEVLDTSSKASKSVASAYQKAAVAQKELTSPIKQSTPAAKKTATHKKRSAATEQQSAAPKKRTVSQKKAPSKEVTRMELELQAALDADAEDKRTLSDLEAKFGDYLQIRDKHDFDTLLEALFTAWNAVNCREDPLQDRWNAMRNRESEAEDEQWDISEDES